jgi:hypothetical protein
MPKRGLEPPHPCEYQLLNLAWLPDSVLRRYCIHVRFAYNCRLSPRLEEFPASVAYRSHFSHIGNVGPKTDPFFLRVQAFYDPVSQFAKVRFRVFLSNKCATQWTCPFSVATKFLSREQSVQAGAQRLSASWKDSPIKLMRWYDDF